MLARLVGFTGQLIMGEEGSAGCRRGAAVVEYRSAAVRLFFAEQIVGVGYSYTGRLNENNASSTCTNNNELRFCCKNIKGLGSNV